MSLVYLITSLPRLKRDKKSPISRRHFIEQVKKNLNSKEFLDFNLILLFEDIEKIICIKNDALIYNDNLSSKLIYNKLKKYKHKLHINLSEFNDLYLKEPSHVLLRKWYQTVYAEANSLFFKEWISFSLNLDEVISAILAKQDNLSKNDFIYQMKGRFDSCSQQMMLNYDDSNLGISKRFAWYEQIKKILFSENFLKAEKELNSLKLKEINKLLGTDVFSIDIIIAYYFHLRIIEREANFSYEKGNKILKLILHDYLEELHDN